MKDFEGKVAFITGGGSGLGFGLAKVFSKAGCKVVIADIRQDHLDQAMAYFSNKKVTVYPLKLDITDRAAFAAAADEVEKVFGKPPELLFNNAGVNTFGPAEATSYDDWDWVLGVNLFGVINGITTFLPRMIKAGKGGHIYATSSGGGFKGLPGVMPYCAAKAAVINMMEAYHQSLEHYGIGVTVCCPGGINTNIAEAVYTRPDHLKETGYVEDEKTIEALKRVYATGVDPVDLANDIKKGIEENKLYIIPAGMDKMLEHHFKEILDSIPPAAPPSPEEIEKMKEGFSHMKDVGKIKSDLTWVKPAPPRPMRHGPVPDPEE